MRRAIYILLSVFVFSSCSIVSLEESDNVADIPDVDISAPDTDLIDLGSGMFPTDSATFASYLHGDGQKTWTADQFIIEGMGTEWSLPCRLDDRITLSSIGVVEYESGDWSCGGEEGDPTDREGSFSFDLSGAKPLVSFTGITGFADETYVGKIWTLEQNTLVVSANYESIMFGSFSVTGRYVSN